MSVIKANDVKIIKDWIDDNNEVFFACDCNAYQESATGVWIHDENKCSSMMEGHVEVTLTRLIEWLIANGPISMRGW